MANAMKSMLDEQQVVNLARKVPVTSWSMDNGFTFLTAYRATVPDSGGDLIIRVTKEGHDKDGSLLKQNTACAYGLSAYRQHKYANGDVREVFVGGTLNNENARRLFNDIDMRDARRKLFD